MGAVAAAVSWLYAVSSVVTAAAAVIRAVGAVVSALVRG